MKYYIAYDKETRILWGAGITPFEACNDARVWISDYYQNYCTANSKGSYASVNALLKTHVCSQYLYEQGDVNWVIKDGIACSPDEFKKKVEDFDVYADNLLNDLAQKIEDMRCMLRDYRESLRSHNQGK